MLTIENLRSGHGALPVLHGISLTLAKGEILAILGRNGVGKTTLLRTIIGDLPVTGGKIIFDGQDISHTAPHVRAWHGLGYVPQGRGIFPKLTVWENLLIGTRANPSSNGKIAEGIVERFPILIEKKAQQGGSLSGGQQQQLALARALCGNPKLLLLDEPGEGIQPSIVRGIGELLCSVAAEFGIAVMIVEQNIDLARQVAQRAIVLQRGEIGAMLDKEAMMDDAVIASAMAL